MKNKTVFILQDTKEINERLSDLFTQEGYETVGLETDGERAVQSVIELNPDFFITELVLRGSDGLHCINEVRNNCPDTKIIVLSALTSEEIISKTLEMGASYFMAKPFNFNLLKNRMEELDCEVQKVNKIWQRKNYVSLEEKISNIFINVGIPPHIKGYSFLREGVKMAVEDPDIINNITKKLYPKIGEKYSTTASKVERAIRHAIEVAWNRGRIDSINSLLGVRAYVGAEKPTNGEFIALVADKMLLEKA